MRRKPRIMKNHALIPMAAAVLLAAAGCDKQSSETTRKLAELEQKNHEAADRQRALEQELEDQKLAAERDAIERERVRIEEDRAALERQQGEEAARQDEAIRQREAALANREGKLEQFQSALAKKEDELQRETEQLSDRDRELAGREALNVAQTDQTEPVADYGLFYDSLASYGSWFETSDYGYVWQPAAVRDSNWRPYSRGRWACSDRGWTWVSDEPFGWATYHYGRWTLIRNRGWIWVPGAEWAPSWVSWRENDSHIGWAPLPPETLAYRGHSWDSTVDVQFSIGARNYSFVEIRHFGSPIYNYCLPISGNGDYFQQTTNITYVHIANRQVICGGPKYKKVSDRIGRPLPFYRLEIDRHPRPNRDATGMRPRIKGNHLLVSAPNIDVAWNDGLKPKRIKDRLESVTVERDGKLSAEISDRYRRSREEGRQQAKVSAVQAGGQEKLEQRRERKRQDETDDLAETPGALPQRNLPEAEKPVVRQPDKRPHASLEEVPAVPADEGVMETPEPLPQQPLDEPIDSARDQENQREDVAEVQEDGRKQQRQVESPRRDQQDEMPRKQDEQARQLRQQEKQREAEQVREAQNEVVRQQREEMRVQRQQQEHARQRDQERAQRQQQEEQQEEMQRQQDKAQQRQQEKSQRRQQNQDRQRQQEDNQRQQDRAQQRQQEENQRQRAQDDSREKQQKEKDEDQRKRNR